MDIAEFVARFIEREDAALKQVVFAFLGYATLAIAGLVYVLKQYCSEDRRVQKQVPDTTRLLVGSFAFAAIACYMLLMKSDARKNFCITWLPALRAADADGHAIEHHNVKGATRIQKFGNRSLTDTELITKFCEDYHRFDMGKGFPKGMEKVYEAPLITRLGYYAQNEYVKCLNFLLVFFSIDCYRTAIRRKCLKDSKAPCVLQILYRWLFENPKGRR